MRECQGWVEIDGDCFEVILTGRIDIRLVPIFGFVRVGSLRWRAWQVLHALRLA